MTLERANIIKAITAALLLSLSMTALPQPSPEEIAEYGASAEAAEQGDSDAQYNLGYMYESGQGVPRNYKVAVNWYHKAADQGHANAQYNLGYMYTNGQGVPKNYKVAAHWYHKAADQGHANAQYKLALIYADGRGVTRNDKAAAGWYRKATNQNEAEAQFDLGVIYANGQGVTQDYMLSRMWFNLAAASGHEDALEYRKKVTQRMRREPIERREAKEHREATERREAEQMRKKAAWQVFQAGAACATQGSGLLGNYSKCSQEERRRQEGQSNAASSSQSSQQRQATPASQPSQLNRPYLTGQSAVMGGSMCRYSDGSVSKISGSYCPRRN